MSPVLGIIRYVEERIDHAAMRVAPFFVFVFAISFIVAVVDSAARPEKAMIPYSGTHNLEQHWFGRGYNGGAGAGVGIARGGLTVLKRSGGVDSAVVYVSDEVRTSFGANELVLTWNADVPDGAWINVSLRVAAPGMDWSGWFDMGNWGGGPADARNVEDAAYGKLKVDQLVTKVNFRTVQYRIMFNASPSGKDAVVRLVSLSYSHVGEGEIDKKMMHAADGKKLSLNVPWISQLRPEDVEDEDMRKAGVCAPTSMTMALNYYGSGVRVREIGRHAFDPVAKIFGNWAFLVATAGDYKYDSWVQRFNNWSEVRKFVQSGAPVIISIAYPKGTFKDDPEKMSNGHLLMVRGFTGDGDVICNDPGTAFSERGDGVVYKWEELGVAFFGHGGVGIVVLPPRSRGKR